MIKESGKRKGRGRRNGEGQGKIKRGQWNFREPRKERPGVGREKSSLETEKEKE